MNTRRKSGALRTFWKHDDTCEKFAASWRAVSLEDACACLTNVKPANAIEEQAITNAMTVQNIGLRRKAHSLVWDITCPRTPKR